LNLLNASILIETDDPQHIRMTQKLLLELDVENKEKQLLASFQAELIKNKMKEKNKVGPDAERSQLYQNENKEGADGEQVEEEEKPEEDDLAFEQKI